jgi:hypothetical protein
MIAGTPPRQSAGLTPAEREARWTLWVRFAIEAASEDAAGAVLSQALVGLNEGPPLRGEPVIHPRHRHSDDIWVAEVAPDLTHLPVIDPDDAKTRCSFVLGHFPGRATWTVPQNTEREAKYEWPLDIWQRQPGRDDVLLHRAVRAVMIFCAAKQA